MRKANTLYGMLLLASYAISAVASDPRPNVVLIVSDDQGWADIGYNNANVYTPNLDRLAREGVTFLQHYVMPQCTPTRVALMTGRYPSRFGGPAMAASNAPAFPVGTPTLAGMLQDNGYETYLTGKWHLGSDSAHGPNRHGFDSSYGSLAGAVGMYDHRYRTGPFEHTWHRDHELIPGGENGKHATDLVTEEAVRVIKKPHAAPFFLYVPFHSVHTPLDERDEFVDRPTQLDPDRPNRWLDEAEICWFHDPEGVIQKEVDPEKRLLLAAAYHLDSSVGKIVQALDESQLRTQTLILFSSDNGPQGSWPGKAYPDDLKLTAFNQTLPFRGKKLDVWEGGIHVPAFANWPGRIKAHQVSEPTHIIDWFPTLAQITASKPTRAVDWDGIDISPLLFSRGQIVDRDLYWTWNSTINRWAVRHGDWKIVKYGKGEPKGPNAWQLFHLGSDPAEKNNVANKHPDIVEALHQRFMNQRSKDK